MLIQPNHSPQAAKAAFKTPAANWEDVAPLCKLCNEGRLYEVEKWIEEDRPLQCIPPTDRKLQRLLSPLQIAATKGFHSLAELLLRNGYDPNADYGSSLDTAVIAKNLSMVELLLQYGADPTQADFRHVMATYDRDIMDRFVEAGADPCSNSAVALALLKKGKPILGFVKTYWERFPGLKRQTSIALLSFVKDDDLKGVSLMLWLGADPYLEVPESPYIEDETLVDTSSSIKAAFFRSDETIIKILLKHPPPAERAQEIFADTLYFGHPVLLKMLLAHGIDMNAPNEEGEPVWLSLVYALSSRFSYFRERDNNAQRLESMKMLAEAGARLELDHKGLANLRRSLLDGRSETIIALLDLFRKYEILSSDALTELTRTPAMRSLLNGYTKPQKDPFADLRPRYYAPIEPPTEPVRRGHWKRHWSQR